MRSPSLVIYLLVIVSVVVIIQTAVPSVNTTQPAQEVTTVIIGIPVYVTIYQTITQTVNQTILQTITLHETFTQTTLSTQTNTETFTYTQPLTFPQANWLFIAILTTLIGCGVVYLLTGWIGLHFPPPPIPPGVLVPPQKQGDVGECECELEDMKIDVRDVGHTTESVYAQFSVKGQVSTNRTTGFVNVGGTYHVLLRTSFPDGPLTLDTEGPIELVVSRDCKEGEIPIDWKSPKKYFELFSVNNKITHDVKEQSTFEVEIRIFGSVEGCGGWSFNTTKRFNINVGKIESKSSYGPIPDPLAYILPWKRRIIPIIEDITQD